jgi:leader peptidase (prepilin peptidase)/N-methyltransferase
MSSAEGAGPAPVERQTRLSAREHIRSLPRIHRLAVAYVSALFIVASFGRFGLSAHAFVGAIFASALVLLTAIDLDRRLIPDSIVLPTLGVVLILQIAFYPDHTLEWVLATLGAAVFFFIPMLIYPAGMGMGDVKLAALLGAALGRSVAAAIAVCLLATVVVSAFVLAREGFGARRKAIAFGPFLALGGLVVFFLGGH